MSGINDLATLLSQLQPICDKHDYVFCCSPRNELPDGFVPKATFREAEGLTIVCLQSDAEKAGLDYEAIFSCITLSVHSSLQAVGLTAAVSKVLADNGISANVIAAYYHDHIFVPKQDTEHAIQLLGSLSTIPIS
ncbi:ACT domain-containing protein [Alteromonas facilis]|uniref:ACT domain-containing protein n=1 Tax=Alteromonas facilis TaxID=2048004 RepID=UPI000C292829|nr:ACT domain-containing protein [Alteromonas facilis]